MVFNLGGDDMVALLPVGKGNTLDGPVVGFAPAGGEVDVRVCAKRLCDLRTGNVNRIFGSACDAVNGGGIAKVFRMIRDHWVG